MAARLSMSIQTARATTDWDMGRAILSAFCTPDPRLTPELLSSMSAQHGAFDGIDACAPFWAKTAKMEARGNATSFAMGMGWRRTHSPQYRAEISTHTFLNNHGTLIEGQLMLHGPFHKDTDWQAFFIRLCAAMGASRGDVRTDSTARNAAIWTLHPRTGDLEGLASIVTLPLTRVGQDHQRRIVEAGFDIAVQEAGVVIPIMPTLAEARDNVPALQARFAALAAILNDGTWQPPKKPSWWDGR